MATEMSFLLLRSAQSERIIELGICRFYGVAERVVVSVVDSKKLQKTDQESSKKTQTLCRRTLFQQFAEHWQLYLLVLLPMAAMFVFHYIPIYGIQVAFKDYSPKLGIIKSPWAGLKYFKQFVDYPKFWQILWNTLRINLLGLATFPLPIILAIMFNDLKHGWFKKTTQMMTYAPHFVSTVVVCSMVLLFLNRETGVFNRIIELFGGKAQDWMGKSKAFAPIYVLSGLWQDLGWDTIIFLAALSGVNPELIEAARMDGATRLGIVWHVYLPHLLPTIITLFLLTIGSLVGVGFEKFFLLQNPLNLDRSTVISTYVYQTGIVNMQLSYSTAINLFQTLINIVLVVTFNYLSRKTTEHSLW